jgi:hypothetical protein
MLKTHNQILEDLESKIPNLKTKRFKYTIIKHLEENIIKNYKKPTKKEISEYLKLFDKEEWWTLEYSLKNNELINFIKEDIDYIPDAYLIKPNGINIYEIEITNPMKPTKLQHLGLLLDWVDFWDGQKAENSIFSVDRYGSIKELDLIKCIHAPSYKKQREIKDRKDTRKKNESEIKSFLGDPNRPKRSTIEVLKEILNKKK